jgi:ABC-type nitrate/sulfonate/bicarbonate transport system substrate-binding protein
VSLPEEICLAAFNHLFKIDLSKRACMTLLLLLASIGSGSAEGPAPVAHPRPLRELKVITFGGASNLPIWAAQRQGFFADEGLEVRLTFTPNSAYQMTQLLAGNYDIAMTAIDNVVAYQEGQNEAPIGPDPDLIAFVGTDNSFLTLVSQGPLKDVQSLRGHILTVDDAHNCTIHGACPIWPDRAAMAQKGDDHVEMLGQRLETP